MKSLGIIAEYNPFHQGHRYLIEKTMRISGAEVCISVMSGNFVQRGTAAVFDKWTRARKAVENGVNLVIELPVVFACSSAEYFAGGGMEILEGLGCVDYLAFGSESGSIELLTESANFLKENHDKLHERIAEIVRKGESYPRARQRAIEEFAPDFNTDAIGEPNNILAVEYLKHNKSMTPLTVKRIGQGHHDSATAIRRELTAENEDKFRRIQENYWNMISAKILQSEGKRLEEIISSGEGLGNKLKNEVRYASSAEELIKLVKSKSYTHSRISRLLTQVLLDIDEKAVKEARSYIRILAVDSIGAKFVKEVKNKKCASLPIITNINKEIKDLDAVNPTLQKDILASDMYNIINGKNLYHYSDYVMKPFVKN